MEKQRKAILVTRNSQFQELVAQYNTESQAKFVIESKGQDFRDYKREHTTYRNAIHDVERALSDRIRVQHIERGFLPNFLFSPDDVVIVIGQDGLVANTLKYLEGQPLIAINPDPGRYDGILLPFVTADVLSVLDDVLTNRFNAREITMAKASLNDGQVLTAVNDLFIGPRYQISARYELEYDEANEIQSSSGLIVSTGLGSTGWLTSLHRGAEKIMGGREEKNPAFAWDSDQLRFAVREPFPSQVTGTDLVYGKIEPKKKFNINSHMACHGVIFSDGMIDDFIDFNSGAVASIGLADTKGQLVS